MQHNLSHHRLGFEPRCPSPWVRRVPAGGSSKPQARTGATRADAAILQPTEAAERSSSSACPVLSALQPVPPSRLNAWERFTWLRTKGARAVVEHELEGRSVATDVVLGIPIVLVGDLDAAKEVVAHETAGNLIMGWDSLNMLIGKNSLSACNDPARHRHLRQLIMPALSTESVESYLHDIHAIVDSTLASWVHTSQEEGKIALAAPAMKRLTFKVITRVIMDMVLDDKEIDEFSKDFTVWSKCLFTPFTINKWPFPFHASMQARERLLARIMKQVHAVREEIRAEQQAAANGNGLQPSSNNRATSSTKRVSTLKRMLTTTDEQGRLLNDEEVGDLLINVLFAGYDTTSTQLTQLINDLQTKPEVLQRVRDEQAAVIARFGPALTPQAMRAMQYTSAVLQEGMRTNPVLGGFLRGTGKDIDVGGHLVPKGRYVQVETLTIASRDPRWPRGTSDPLDLDNYNPDRFMSPEGQQQGSQLYFGMGPHICAGMALAQAEAKVFLATWARGYDIRADINTKWRTAPFPWPDNQLPVWTERLGQNQLH